MKNILIIGNSRLVNISENDSNIIKRALNDNNNYDIDNLSKNSLGIDEAYNYVKEFTKYRNYSYALISLGEADYYLNTDIDDFKNKLDLIINELNNKKVKIYLTLPFMKDPLINQEYRRNIYDIYERYHNDIVSVEDKKENRLFNKPAFC